MATNTYVALDKVTVGSNTTSVTFTSIPQGYTDLVLVAVAKDSNNYTGMRVNNSSAANYSRTYITWNGTTAASSRTTGDTTLYVGGNDTNFEVSIYNFQNYSNTTTYKTILGTQKIANATSIAAVGLWRSTAAITEIDIYSVSGTSILAGSTFSLYGIKAWTAETTPKATGGYVYEDSTYYYHAFPFSSTFTPNQSLTADILVVAGGGGTSGGGSEPAGGGGAGGLLAFSSQALSATNYSVTVGAGGAGQLYSTPGNSGSNSQFGSLTACIGGGRGGLGNGGAGAVGGSGGGGSGWNAGAGAAGTSGQGYAGGTGRSGSTAPYSSGGGGGAGGTGYNGDSPSTGGGNGGVGATSSFINAIGAATTFGQTISGSTYFAGGGGGGSFGTGARIGLGGYGGGGNGVDIIDANGTNGTVSTGGGGGSASGSGRGGSGGSGVVIVRYAK